MASYNLELWHKFWCMRTILSLNLLKRTLLDNSSFEDFDYVGKVVHSDLLGPLPNFLDFSKHMWDAVKQMTRYMTLAGPLPKSDTTHAQQW